jgi:oxygen-independent coproporphyrinogen-3 oxidase
MQERCIEAMAAAGYAQYEVSAYAQPGKQCAHNLNYWRYGDYLGIGAGAHGKLTLGARKEIRRSWKVKNPRDYLASAGTPAGIGGDEPVAAPQRPFDYMLNALRLVEGFALKDFEARTGLGRGAIAGKLESARERGWVEVDHGRVVPTELGRRFTNDVISLFLE